VRHVALTSSAMTKDAAGIIRGKVEQMEHYTKHSSLKNFELSVTLQNAKIPLRNSADEGRLRSEG